MLPDIFCLENNDSQKPTSSELILPHDIEIKIDKILQKYLDNGMMWYFVTSSVIDNLRQKQQK